MPDKKNEAGVPAVKTLGSDGAFVLNGGRGKAVAAPAESGKPAWDITGGSDADAAVVGRALADAIKKSPIGEVLVRWNGKRLEFKPAYDLSDGGEKEAA